LARFLRLLAASALLAMRVACAEPDAPFITLSSTTSTEQSGLFTYLLPQFVAQEGIEVHVVAVGTGQALDIARRGDADALLVHDPKAEEQFVNEGHSLRRSLVMYNDFVLIGPLSDPAAIAGTDVVVGLERIANAQVPFVSRGDRSGTHEAELRLWSEAGIDLSRRRGRWYRDTGSGMGAALNIASAMNAYVLADRGTWLNFHNRGELIVLVSGDKRLFNQYSVMVVNPALHPGVKSELAYRFANWMTGAAGQSAIASYRIAGEQVFFPNALPNLPR
jgi:tungstate transport system substrate-binding protein